ncbi:hypothetical protein OROGR_014846 [Orobanche gracilis]
MDEFHLANQNPNPKATLLHMNPNMELFSNLALMESFDLSNEGFSDHHHHHQPQIPMALNDEIPRSIDPMFNLTAHMISALGNGWNNTNMAQDHGIQMNISPSVSGAGFLGHNKVNKIDRVPSYGGKKRRRMGEIEMEKPKEVVHVRAKRGQATDSHSLAERLRREKINDKLRCLQDLVPGCYKTMGMAVMLDVIINYVRSLQNQIDFLSMKLSAASLYYDFNSSDAEAMESIQGTNIHGHEEAAQMMEKLMGEGYGGIQTSNWTL